MSNIFQKASAFTLKYKIIRGMISYSILWPVGNLLQQTFIEQKNIKTYDWMKCLRFSVYGAFIMGPTMYLWMRFAAKLWPNRDVKSSLSKALTEQVSYDPAAICTFLYFMTLMEGRTKQEAKHEISAKFFDTYKIGAVYWPIVQTFNFTFIPVRNQVVCTSFFSMLWSAFLAYMKHLEIVARKNKHGKDEYVTVKQTPAK